MTETANIQADSAAFVRDALFQVFAAYPARYMTQPDERMRAQHIVQEMHRLIDIPRFIEIVIDTSQNKADRMGHLHTALGVLAMAPIAVDRLQPYSAAAVTRSPSSQTWARQQAEADMLLLMKYLHFCTVAMAERTSGKRPFVVPDIISHAHLCLTRHIHAENVGRPRLGVVPSP
jgi:hypothetical protein